jgi:L-gulono-1,4-lactone dehydrogenase
MYINSKYTFVNWARNVRAKPAAYFLPENTDDVCAIVKRALAEDKKVRVVGSGHSWSAAVATNDFLVSLDKLNRIVFVNKDLMQVTIQGGVKLKNLHTYLYPLGLAMVNIGSISEQTIAGAISTATHGTGLQYGILATQVLSLKLVNGLGNEIELSAANGDDFKAAVVSLGCMGIITEVTLQCTKAYHVEEIAAPVLFADAVDALANQKHAEHYKMWWFPHTKYAMVYNYRKVPDAVRDTFTKQYIDDGFVSNYFFKAFLSLGHLNPNFRPQINRMLGTLFLKKINRVNLNYKVLNVPMPPRHREAEYAFAADKVKLVLHSLHKLIEQHNMKMNFVVEVRFTKGDDYFLSPCYGQDTCYIGFYLAGNKNWEHYLGLFEDLVMAHGGRPHLGKEFRLNGAYLKQVMPGLQRFNQLRKQYDPNNVFENKFTQMLFAD